MDNFYYKYLKYKKKYFNLQKYETKGLKRDDIIKYENYMKRYFTYKSNNIYETFDMKIKDKIIYTSDYYKILNLTENIEFYTAEIIKLRRLINKENRFFYNNNLNFNLIERINGVIEKILEELDKKILFLTADHIITLYNEIINISEIFQIAESGELKEIINEIEKNYSLDPYGTELINYLQRLNITLSFIKYNIRNVIIDKTFNTDNFSDLGNFKKDILLLTKFLKNIISLKKYSDYDLNNPPKINESFIDLIKLLIEIIKEYLRKLSILYKLYFIIDDYEFKLIRLNDELKDINYIPRGAIKSDILLNPQYVINYYRPSEDNDGKIKYQYFNIGYEGDHIVLLPQTAGTCWSDAFFSSLFNDGIRKIFGVYLYIIYGFTIPSYLHAPQDMISQLSTKIISPKKEKKRHTPSLLKDGGNPNYILFDILNKYKKFINFDIKYFEDDDKALFEEIKNNNNINKILFYKVNESKTWFLVDNNNNFKSISSEAGSYYLPYDDDNDHFKLFESVHDHNKITFRSIEPDYDFNEAELIIIPIEINDIVNNMYLLNKFIKNDNLYKLNYLSLNIKTDIAGHVVSFIKKNKEWYYFDDNRSRINDKIYKFNKYEVIRLNILDDDFYITSVDDDSDLITFKLDENLYPEYSFTLFDYKLKGLKRYINLFYLKE